MVGAMSIFFCDATTCATSAGTRVCVCVQGPHYVHIPYCTHVSLSSCRSSIRTEFVKLRGVFAQVPFVQVLFFPSTLVFVPHSGSERLSQSCGFFIRFALTR